MNVMHICAVLSSFCLVCFVLGFFVYLFVFNLYVLLVCSFDGLFSLNVCLPVSVCVCLFGSFPVCCFSRSQAAPFPSVDSRCSA